MAAFAATTPTLKVGIRPGDASVAPARDAPSRVAHPGSSRNRVSEKKKPYPLQIGPGDASLSVDA